MRDQPVISEPGAEALRAQLGVEPEDPSVFRPPTLDECVDAMRIVLRDSALTVRLRAHAEVGLILDLMPDHLTPRRVDLARRLGCAPRTVRRRELAWEGCDSIQRHQIVHRAIRLLLAMRAANR